MSRSTLHSTTQPLALTRIEDSGHSWLLVPMDYLRALGIESKISPYSYRSGDLAYLEEDCDYPLFETAADNAGWELSIDERFIDGLCFVRDLPQYRRSR